MLEKIENGLKGIRQKAGADENKTFFELYYKFSFKLSLKKMLKVVEETFTSREIRLKERISYLYSDQLIILAVGAA